MTNQIPLIRNMTSEAIINKGYKEIFSENLDFFEKIQLFSECNNLVLEMGAGLRIYFLPKGEIQR